VSLRLEPGDLSLATLDRLDVDSLAAFVGPERPLTGLAGLVDWRLCGAVSRAILAGTFAPEKGDVLLLPSGGRFPTPRVFCFGHSDGGDAALAAGARWACGVLAKAGAQSVAAALPAGPLAAALVRALVRASGEAGFSRLALLGEGRALAKEAEAAVREFGVDAEVVPFHSRAEPPPPAASLPGRGPVVR